LAFTSSNAILCLFFEFLQDKKMDNSRLPLLLLTIYLVPQRRPAINGWDRDGSFAAHDSAIGHEPLTDGS
jgi:hypothetical protein